MSSPTRNIPTPGRCSRPRRAAIRNSVADRSTSREHDKKTIKAGGPPMNIREYAKYDATGLAELVRKKEVSPKELALTAAEAIAKANPAINGVVETYDDRIDGLDEISLGNGPFRGVPLLMKDVFGHEKGRKI